MPVQDWRCKLVTCNDHEEESRPRREVDHARVDSKIDDAKVRKLMTLLIRCVGFLPALGRIELA